MTIVASTFNVRRSHYLKCANFENFGDAKTCVLVKCRLPISISADGRAGNTEHLSGGVIRRQIKLGLNGVKPFDRCFH